MQRFPAALSLRPAAPPSRARGARLTALFAATLAAALALGCSSGNNSIAFRWLDSDCDGVSDDVLAPVLTDADADGVVDGCDNCPTVSNPTQEDCDRNGVGEVCQDGDVSLDKMRQ